MSHCITFTVSLFAVASSTSRYLIDMVQPFLVDRQPLPTGSIPDHTTNISSSFVFLSDGAAVARPIIGGQATTYGFDSRSYMPVL